jgi:hypothetical protein
MLIVLHIPLFASYGYNAGVLILIGCILAYHTKDVDRKFGESKQLGEYLNKRRIVFL